MDDLDQEAEQQLEEGVRSAQALVDAAEARGDIPEIWRAHVGLTTATLFLRIGQLRREHREGRVAQQQFNDTVMQMFQQLSETIAGLQQQIMALRGEELQQDA
jgi:hypothetical protein